MKKLLFIVNVDWFFLSHRLAIAQAARKLGFEVSVATKITNNLAVLKEQGFKVYPLKMSRSGLGVFELVWTFYQIARLVHQTKPDLVHLVTIKPVLIGGLICRIFSVPGVLVAISGLGFVFTENGLLAKLRRFVVKKIYKIVLNHKNLIAVFQNTSDLETLSLLTGLPASKTRLVNGSGVNLRQYVPSSPPSSDPVVMLASRLLTNKGIMDFVDAAKIIKLKYRGTTPNPRFVLVGAPDQGNPTSISESTIKKWADEDLIEWWGHQNDMSRILAKSTIVVLPSYREGLPKVLLEAAACARPIVTTDVPGCRDAIINNVTGILVKSRDSRGLANGIDRLLESPELQKQMGKAGRKLAEQRFSQSQVVSEHLSFYKVLLKASRKKKDR